MDEMMDEYVPLTDEELTALADELFLELDSIEAPEGSIGVKGYGRRQA